MFIQVLRKQEHQQDRLSKHYKWLLKQSIIDSFKSNPYSNVEVHDKVITRSTKLIEISGVDNTHEYSCKQRDLKQKLLTLSFHMPNNSALCIADENENILQVKYLKT